jgi:hypothetical protein
MSNTLYSYQILVKLEFSGQILKKKFLKYQISFKNSFPWGGGVWPGCFMLENERAGTPDDSKDRFLQFF